MDPVKPRSWMIPIEDSDFSGIQRVHDVATYSGEHGLPCPRQLPYEVSVKSRCCEGSWNNMGTVEYPSLELPIVRGLTRLALDLTSIHSVLPIRRNATSSTWSIGREQRMWNQDQLEIMCL